MKVQKPQKNCITDYITKTNRKILRGINNGNKSKYSGNSDEFRTYIT